MLEHLLHASLAATHHPENGGHLVALIHQQDRVTYIDKPPRAVCHQCKCMFVWFHGTEDAHIVLHPKGITSKSRFGRLDAHGHHRIM